VTKKKLDLLQFATADVTQLGTSSAQIVRGEVIELKAAGTVPNGIPNDALGDPVPPGRSVPTDSPENTSFYDICRYHPSVHGVLHPNRHWHGADMSPFFDQVDDRPVALTNLNIFFPQ
jgi:hypothetical protein